MNKMDTNDNFADRFFRAKTVFRIITGTMTTWILMIAFQADQSTPVEIVLDLAVFAALLLISYVFASILGEEIVAQRQTNLRRVFEMVVDVSPVLLATVPPFLIFTIASFGIISVKTGLLLSDLSHLAILFGVGFVAGKSIGAVRRGLLDGTLAAGIGLGLVVLRAIVV